MRKAKRRGDDLTRRFPKNKIASKNVSGRLVVDCNRDFWSGLGDGLKSYLSKSVASITLCNGDAILFSCSGIAIERQGCYLTRFLTSARLVKALNATNKDHDDLKIEVRHEGNEVHMGVMGEFDLDHNFAVVNVHAFLDVQVGPFQSALEILPHGETLVAVGRGVSGEIVAKSMELDDDSRLSEDDDGDLDCNISEALEGGHVLSMDGKVGGMYLLLTRRKTVFLPWDTIIKHLELYWTSQQKKTGLAQSRTLKVNRFGPMVEKSNSHPEVEGDFLNQEQLDLDSMGYPKLPPSMLGAGMILVNTFEKPFGDIHGEGVWRKFSTRASNINNSVVALASFNGEKRFFACTGFIIEWNGSKIILTSASLVRKSGDENKIIEHLRIDVLLNNEYIEGTLQHYNLHYNVALVSVEAPDLCPSNTLLYWNRSFKVAAVGLCFQSKALMATSGDLVPWTGTLDCDFLAHSTCKISKAGIGGPLVNFDGDVIGMNFYDKRIGTPFLFWADICKILASFETKSKFGEVGNDSDPCGVPFWKMNKDRNTKLNSWPVPMPRWCHLGAADEDTSDDDNELGFEPKSGRQRRYSYFKGKKIELF
ncbi:unnamed protein product [Urochloa humidicola]